VLWWHPFNSIQCFFLWQNGFRSAKLYSRWDAQPRVEAPDSSGVYNSYVPPHRVCEDCATTSGFSLLAMWSTRHRRALRIWCCSRRHQARRS
jgi:hypothetical protein